MVNKRKVQLRKKIKNRPKSRKPNRTKRRIASVQPAAEGKSPKTLKASELIPDQDQDMAPDDASSKLEVMSQVIYDFAEPLLKTCQNEDEQKKAISLAIYVWNTALLPEAEQAQALNGYLANAEAALPPEEYKNLSEIIHQMVETKKTEHADNRNKITNCTFGDIRGGRHIEVGYAWVAPEETEPPTEPSEE